MHRVDHLNKAQWVRLVRRRAGSPDGSTSDLHTRTTRTVANRTHWKVKPLGIVPSLGFSAHELGKSAQHGANRS